MPQWSKPAPTCLGPRITKSCEYTPECDADKDAAPHPQHQQMNILPVFSDKNCRRPSEASHLSENASRPVLLRLQACLARLDFPPVLHLHLPAISHGCASDFGTALKQDTGQHAMCAWTWDRPHRPELTKLPECEKLACRDVFPAHAGRRARQALVPPCTLQRLRQETHQLRTLRSRHFVGIHLIHPLGQPRDMEL